jgi:hypothetical protein
MSDVIGVAEFTEGIAAAFQLTICTDRSTTVGTFAHSSLATRHSNVAIAGKVFDLARLDSHKLKKNIKPTGESGRSSSGRTNSESAKTPKLWLRAPDLPCGEAR